MFKISTVAVGVLASQLYSQHFELEMGGFELRGQDLVYKSDAEDRQVSIPLKGIGGAGVEIGLLGAEIKIPRRVIVSSRDDVWVEYYEPYVDLCTGEVAWNELLRVPESVPVEYSEVYSGSGSRVGGTQISFGFIGDDNPTYPDSLVGGAIDKALDAIRDVLEHETSPANIHILFEWNDGMGSAVAAAGTPIGGECETSYPGLHQKWSDVRAKLDQGYLPGGADADAFEEGFQNSYPLGSTIKISRLDDSLVAEEVDTENIWLTQAQYDKWFNLGNTAPLYVRINSDPRLPPTDDWPDGFPIQYDFDPTDGIGSGPFPAYDFIGAIIHEVVHHLGFVSSVGLHTEYRDHGDQPPVCMDWDSISLWDVYHLSVGDAPLLANFSSATMNGMFPRELRDNNVNPAYAILSPGQTGDDVNPVLHRDGGHWKESGGQFGTYVGIMNPSTIPNRPLSIAGTYLSDMDVRAIDLLGWVVNQDGSPLPAEPENEEPGDAVEIDTSSSLYFDWSQESHATGAVLYVYDEGLVGENVSRGSSVPQNSTLVYRHYLPTGSDITVGVGQFSQIPGHSYRWHVGVEYPRGFALTNPTTYSIQGSPPEPKPCGSINESAKLIGPSGGYNNAELGFDVAIDGEWAAAGSPSYKSTSAPLAGRVEIYKQDGSLWRHHQTILSPNPQIHDGFGTAVDIDGNYMVVGAAQARDYNIYAGLAYVYELVNDEWVHMQTLEPGDAVSLETDHFGFSAAISGTRIIVGAPWHQENNNSQTGSAYVFELDQGVWDQTHQFFPSANDFPGDVPYGDNFGWSVSLDGDRVAIGAYQDEVEDINSSDSVTSGSATIYEYDGMSWSETGKVSRPPSDDLRYNDYFGHAVSISGDTLVVGAYNASIFMMTDYDPGIVYTFDWDGVQWSTSDVLQLPGTVSDGSFGFSVAVQGDILVVGADVGDGQAFLFRRPNSSWEFAHELTRTDEDSVMAHGGRFGNAVDIDDGRVIGGATYASSVPGNAGAYRGAAYIHQVRACLADLNDDGQLNFYDVSQFLTWNSEGDLRADWNCDGVLDFFDTSKFLEYYNGGCP